MTTRAVSKPREKRTRRGPGTLPAVFDADLYAAAARDTASHHGSADDESSTVLNTEYDVHLEQSDSESDVHLEQSDPESDGETARPAGDMNQGFIDPLDGDDSDDSDDSDDDDSADSPAAGDPDEPRDAHCWQFNLDNDSEVRTFAEAFNYGTLAVLSPREILSVALYQVKATKNVPLDTHLEYLEIISALTGHQSMDTRTVEALLERLTGIRHERFDVCRNGCVCFASPELQNLSQCPECNSARHDQNGKPHVHHMVFCSTTDVLIYR